jgi:hypothetical protein
LDTLKDANVTFTLRQLSCKSVVQIKNKSGAYDTYWEEQKHMLGLVRKSERKRPLRRHCCIGKDNIEKYLEVMIW